MRTYMFIFTLLISTTIYADVNIEPDTSCCGKTIESIENISYAINSQTSIVNDISVEIKDLNQTIKTKQIKCPEINKNDDCSPWGSIIGALISGIIAIIIFIIGYLIEKKKDKSRKLERLSEIRIHLFNLIGQIIESINIQTSIIDEYTTKIETNPYDIYQIEKFNHSDLERLLLLDSNDIRQIFVNNNQLGISPYINLYRNIDHVQASLSEIFINLKSYSNSEIRDLIKKVVSERNELFKIISTTSTEVNLSGNIVKTFMTYNKHKSVSVDIQYDFKALINPLHQIFKNQPELIAEYPDIFNQNMKIGNYIMTLSQMNQEQMNHMQFESKELKKTLINLEKIYNKNKPK